MAGSDRSNLGVAAAGANFVLGPLIFGAAQWLHGFAFWQCRMGGAALHIFPCDVSARPLNRTEAVFGLQQPALRRLCLRGLALPAFLIFSPLAFALYQGEPGPLTDAHLKIIKPANLLNATGGPAPSVKSQEAVFGSAANLSAGPLRAAVNVRFAGDYALWVRVGQASGERLPVQVELSRDNRRLLAAQVNDGLGAPGLGGLNGLRDYTQKASANTPKSAAIKDMSLHMDHQGSLKLPQSMDKNAMDAGDLLDNLMVEMKTGTADQWINMNRIEKPGAGAFYWWKVGKVSLSPGRHDLNLSALKPRGKSAALLMDAAILTGATNLLYPYIQDITSPRASYIRFRIDRMPPKGITVSVSMITHIHPYYYSGSGACNPEGMRTQGAAPHTRLGYTRWYCLQDLKHSAGVGHGAEQSFHLSLGGGKRSEMAGATQFAMLPYADEVVREIDWDEPSGCGVSMMMDFEKFPERLRTFRDHSREHYERAMQASGWRIFPLTTHELTLQTGGGGNVDSVDYIAKTLRVLGINSGGAGDYGDGAAYARFFNMVRTANQKNPTLWRPGMSEEEGRRQFAKFYESFKRLGTNVTANYMVDEPGESWSTDLSAPLWVYEEPENGAPRWMDHSGSSALHTRFTGYSNCVLEGTFQRFGNFDWRVGCDNSTNPANYGLWRIGKVNPNDAPENLAYSLIVNGKETRRLAVVHKAAGVKSGSFKIVWDGPRAALFLNNALISELSDLPESGGFGFARDKKAITKLSIRPITRKERLGGPDADTLSLGSKVDNAALDLEEELAAEAGAQWAKPKSLKAFVEDDWVPSGGIPGLSEAYTAWLKKEGVSPSLFGKKDFDGIKPMVIQSLATTPELRREFYWGQRYKAYLTPRMYALAVDGIQDNAVRPGIGGFVALSGDTVDRSQAMPMDLFQLAQYTNGLMPGISDWSTGRWTEQAAAFNVAFFNAGARRFDGPPASRIMMHCVHPSIFRAYTCLGHNTKYISYWNFGPIFSQPYIDWWSDRYHCYPACSYLNNRVTQVDDLAAPGRLRPSRVAQLHSMSQRHWGDGLFADKRLTFLALAQDYFQPELVNEDHIAAGDLAHFDALYVLDRHVSAPARKALAAWVEKGGILWLCADAGTRNEYDEHDDLLEKLTGAKRDFTKAEPPAKDAPKPPPLRVKPAPGEQEFLAHTVVAGNMPTSIEWPGARVRAVYDSGKPAWMEKQLGKGRVVYLGHRAGLTCHAKGLNNSDTGRLFLSAPLFEAGVKREVWLSEPSFMACPLSAEGGTLVVLYSMHAAARSNVVLHIREPRKPFSVEIFDDYKLVPLESDFANGLLSVKLPTFGGAQMLSVRSQPPPKGYYEEKQAVMRAQAETLLADADNPNALSAGAFLAAADPSWGLAEKIVPLLKHKTWFVRRQAAETISMLEHNAAAKELAAAAATETDAHALAEEILALARFKNPAARDLILKHLSDEGPARSIYLKRMITVAASEMLFEKGRTNAPALSKADRAFGIKVAEAALDETDVRVQREGISLIARLDPKEALKRAIDGWETNSRTRQAWISAIAQNNEMFNGYAAENYPGRGDLFFSVASARADARLVSELESRLDKATTNTPYGASFASAIARQNNPKLVLKALHRRKELPKDLVSRLPYLLDRLYNARLGRDLQDWETWLEARALK